MFYAYIAHAVSQARHYKLSEAEFWKRYFQSKLFNAHRASIRSSATQHVVRDDPIFDKYLEKDDDGTTLLSYVVMSFISFDRAGAPKTTKRSLRPIYRYRSNARGPCRGSFSLPYFLPFVHQGNSKIDRQPKGYNDASRATTRRPPSHQKIQRAL